MRRTAIRAGLVGLLLGATVVYGNLEKRVIVRIEGQIRPVKTFALTVGDALQRAGIPVGPEDRVAPELGRRLRDGLHIRIDRAKPVTITLNGKPRRVVVTALTVDDMLREIALRSSMRDFVGASRSARVYPGMTLEYRQAAGVTVVHDDEKDRVVTNAASVKTMLSELKISLGPKDKVQPSLSAYPVDGMTVKVLRVGERKEQREREIAFATKTRRDRSIEYARRIVVQKGRPGLKVYRYLSTYVDGVRVKRKLLGVSTTRKAVPTIIAVGTRFPWCACNRGSQNGVASWYDAEGLTAAHKTLPFGTVVKVTNLATGRSVNVVIRDRGPYVRGRVIDMSANAYARLARLGSGVVRVTVRW
ncbi:MAG: ubiquitin-like domain-containing protein [Actinomycetota bacterium]